MGFDYLLIYSIIKIQCKTSTELLQFCNSVKNRKAVLAKTWWNATTAVSSSMWHHVTNTQNFVTIPKSHILPRITSPSRCLSPLSSFARPQVWLSLSHCASAAKERSQGYAKQQISDVKYGNCNASTLFITPYFTLRSSKFFSLELFCLPFPYFPRKDLAHPQPPV